MSKVIKKTKSSVPQKPKVQNPLDKEQEVELFRSLVHMTAVEAAKASGLDKYYNTNGALRIYVFNLANKIRKNPDVWGVSKDTLDLVQAALDSRQVTRSSVFIKEKEKLEFKDRLEVIRDTAADILEKKLNIINKNKGTLEGVKLKEISDILAMSIDKLRLTKGESTENIIHYSKVNLDNVTPEEAMKLVLKARDTLIESKK